jgi:hypothetical protein
LNEAAGTIDPRRCPLCGGGNACAMASGACGDAQAQRDPCWCVGVRFAPALLARVPPALQHKACICAACAQAAQERAD